MHLYHFNDLQLGAGYGDGALADVTSLIDAALAPRERMPALIAKWEELRPRVEGLVATGPAIPIGEVTVRAPLPRPSTVLAAPVNYRRHQEEMGGDGGVYDGAEVQTIEAYAGFVKASSSVVGPDETIRLPARDRRFDHEAEVGVVIGRRACAVPRERAMAHVFGFVPLLDITMRGAEDRSFRKSCDSFTPIGPAIVTADQIADHAAIAFELTVNGDVRQRANTRDLIYDVARLIELYSSAITLEPGDLIATGTPEGVGEIRPGDEIVLSVDGIGRLEMRVTTRVPSPLEAV